MVFAESALGSDTAIAHRSTCEPLPAPGSDTYLCEDSGTPVASMMSCLARKYFIVIVFCLCDVQGTDHYNTQMAIDSDGRLLAKYHKMHPYSPSERTKCIGDGHVTPVPDPAYFDTAFGVRFGMTLCYDIKFHTPAQALAVSNLGIHDIVFSTHWENEEGPPMGLSVALFQAWSRGTGANLLAANAGMGLMHTGSGIFSRGEALATSWRPGSPHDEVLLITRVPRLRATTPNYAGGRPGEPWGTEPLSRALPVWRLVEISPGQANTTETVQADPGFACTFTFSTKDGAGAANPELHVLVAVNGSWFGGGLPARACVMYRVPKSNLPGA